MDQAIKHNPSIMGKTFLFVIYFLYLFSLQFVFMPGGLGTRALLGALGVGYLFVAKLDFLVSVFRTGKLMVKIRQLRIIIALALFFAMACITNLANGTSERSFLTFPISMAMIFSAAFMIVDITRRIYRRLTFEIVANYFIAIVLFQVYIALAMFLVPELRTITSSFFVTEGILLDELFSEDSFRLMGLGVQFFGAGIINSITLMLISVMFRNDCKSLRRAFYLTFAFLSIFPLGMMMSRTTLIGAGLAMGILVLGVKFRRGSTKNLRRVFVSLGIISAVIVSLYGTISSDNRDLLEGAGEYGFEMFVNYYETGEASTVSSDQLKGMYDTYPDDPKTWLIGDGYFAHPTIEGSYYMFTDVGYIRLIFYSGLIGMLLFVYYQYTLLASINDNTRGKYRQLLFFLYIFALIVNFKGFADISSMIAPFMFLTPTIDQKKWLK